MSRALSEMDYLAWSLHQLSLDDCRSRADIQRALEVGQEIVAVCKQRLKLIDNGFDITGYDPPSLIKRIRGGLAYVQ